MNNAADLSHNIRQHLLQILQMQDRNAEVRLKRTSMGWLRLQVVSSIFEQQLPSSREKYVDELLTQIKLHLDDFPFLDYTLLTPEEAAQNTSTQPSQMPLWSDILMAPEPEEPISLDKEDDLTKRPFITTFYSFKGGVGRSTALGCVANILATSGQRVVMIDLDLEAPGLSFMFPSNQANANTLGVLDYVHQRYLLPEGNEPRIEDCIRQIEMPKRGELYLVPAGSYDEDYIHRLADLDIRLLYQREANPIHQLLEDVKSYLNPDVILLDARTGFTEIGAIALFDKADLGVICFSPTSQSFEGLKWVVKAASKQRSYNGIPDLRFLLTPMPPVAHSQQQQWLAQAAEWIAEHWAVPTSVAIDDLYYQIPYNPSITTLANLSDDITSGMLEPYRPVAETILGSLSETKPAIPKLIDRRTAILSELNFQSATAQDIQARDIPTIFQRTGDFTKFLQDRTWLVRGAKGTGKTLLFRLFIERPNDAKKLAEPDSDLRHVEFVPGHGPVNLRPTLLNSGDLKSYEEQTAQSDWKSFWHNYLLLQLVAAIPELQQTPFIDKKIVTLSKSKATKHADIVNWLVERAHAPKFAPIANDELRAIDSWLQTYDRRVWLFYDELDLGFGQDYDLRSRSLGALLEWWTEFGVGLSNIIPKILLREDIWPGLNFTNKAHFSSRTVPLRWEEDDLWRLILRQALAQSSTFATLLREQSAIELAELEKLSRDQLRRSLYPFWNDRMGRTNKAYTHNWVLKRISDSKKNSFPRSLIQLLQKAVEIEKELTERNDRNIYESVLRPRALIEALPFVSKERVAEVRNEYPEFAPLLDKLSNERSPIALERLSEVWHKTESELIKSLLPDMIEAGILQEYQRSSDVNGQRYSVAELYLSGLNMRRQGQR